MAPRTPQTPSFIPVVVCCNGVGKRTEGPHGPPYPPKRLPLLQWWYAAMVWAKGRRGLMAPCTPQKPSSILAVVFHNGVGQGAILIPPVYWRKGACGALYLAASRASH
jgi:hypothetical protein